MTSQIFAWKRSMTASPYRHTNNRQDSIPKTKTHRLRAFHTSTNVPESFILPANPIHKELKSSPPLPVPKSIAVNDSESPDSVARGRRNQTPRKARAATAAFFSLAVNHGSRWGRYGLLVPPARVRCYRRGFVMWQRERGDCLREVMACFLFLFMFMSPGRESPGRDSGSWFSWPLAFLPALGLWDIGYLTLKSRRAFYIS